MATFLFRRFPKTGPDRPQAACVSLGQGQSPCFFPAGLNYSNHGVQFATHQISVSLLPRGAYRNLLPRVSLLYLCRDGFFYSLF